MPQARITINAVIGSNNDLPINTLVQLDNVNVGGEVSFLWEILDQPAGAADVLSAPTIQNPTFTPNKEGTYLVRLTVNQGLPSEDIDSVVAAVLQPKTRQGIPAAGEQTEASTSRGWAVDVNQHLRSMSDAIADPGTVVGANIDSSSLVRGRIVRATGTQTIKPGLPGEEDIPGFEPALASAGGDIDELLLVVEGDIDGNTPVPVGGLGVFRFIGRHATLPLGGGSIGDTVFVSDTATISLTPGTNRRAVGSIMATDGGANRDIWFAGTQGGDNAPIDPKYVVYGDPGTLPNANRIDGLNATGAVNNIPYTFRAGDVTTVALVAKRFSNTGADPIQVHDESGTVLSKVRADGGIEAGTDAVDTVPLIARRFSSSGADLFQVQDESSVVLSRARVDGGIEGGSDLANADAVTGTATVSGIGVGVVGVGAPRASAPVGSAGSGVKGTGGNQTTADGIGGIGGEFTGGDSSIGITVSVGGAGVSGIGGDGFNVGGIGGDFKGGLTSAGSGGIGHGVKGTASNTPQAVGVLGISNTGSSSAGVRGEGIAGSSGPGVVGIGGSADGRGGFFTGGDTNGMGAQGTGKGTGTGVKGLGIDGYGIIAESDTTTPAKAALRIVPQDADPGTAPARGDAYVNTASGKLSIHNNDDFDRYVPQSFAAIVASDISNTTAVTAFSEKYTIPAGTLRIGSTIRVKAWGRHVNDAGGGTVNFRMHIGGTSVVFTTTRTLTTGEAFSIESWVTVRTLGASGLVTFGKATHGPGGSTVMDILHNEVSPTNDPSTVQDVEILALMSVANAGNTVRLQGLIVDVT